MATTDISVDEIIQTLKRSCLPSVIVEGKDDLIVYRKFEERLSHLGVSIFPVGGRDKVLDIYLRRDEILGGAKPVFIADLDSWVISGVPEEYRTPSIVFTTGYSIENDVYIDGRLRSILNKDEELKYEKELQDFIEWYALALSRHLIDASRPIALHPDLVLNSKERPGLMALEENEAYPDHLKNLILERHEIFLRGKSLMWIFIRNASYRGRRVKHNHSALMELVAVRPGTLLDRICGKIALHFE